MTTVHIDVLPPRPTHEEEENTLSNEDPLLRLPSSSTTTTTTTTTSTTTTLPFNQTNAHPYRSHRAGPSRRRNIGKGIQLILLRKYVQCAKELNRLPDRLLTEELLEQGYDEFYYQGGNLNEYRLNYTAFLKLVRNRRSEVRGSSLRNHQRGGTRRSHKEQMEIQMLINELEHVRQAQTRNTMNNDALGTISSNEHSRPVMTDMSVPILSDSSSMMGNTRTDGGVSTEDVSASETYSSVMSGTDEKNDSVVVSQSELEVMLRVAQETLMAQKKILEEVRAIEQRIAAIY
ncbi:unnamed protein product [Peronospora belbahrii]|uniref:Uncharacterized protein n=1 Tax=Peronospora belbahrii TaxID=622444 RepID=A0AAU9L644_9STRA|nr:unnamed protein product [Peronospora belbahrii]CAH0515107.1 unnamed protein product [Peronospora belbahrii]